MNHDNKIKSCTIQALGSFVEVLQPSEVKQFYSLVPQTIETTLYLLENDEDLGQKAIGVLCDIAESEPKFFKNDFAVVFSAMHKITFSKKIDD